MRKTIENTDFLAVFDVFGLHENEVEIFEIHIYKSVAFNNLK